MLGSLASVPLPATRAAPVPPLGLDPLQVALRRDHHIEVPVMRWPAPALRLLRVSPQAYNSDAQYAWLAQCLRAELDRERSSQTAV